MNNDADITTVSELIAYLETVLSTYGDINLWHREADEDGPTFNQPYVYPEIRDDCDPLVLLF